MKQRKGYYGCRQFNRQKPKQPGTMHPLCSKITPALIGPCDPGNVRVIKSIQLESVSMLADGSHVIAFRNAEYE